MSRNQSSAPRPALGALQPEQVGPPPHHGGQKAAELDAHHLGDGEALAHVVVSRVSGLILAALSVETILDGIRETFSLAL